MTIWKYSLDTTDNQQVMMPLEARLLSVQTQGGSPQLWALVDPKARQVQRRIRIYGTGNPVGEYGKFVGTYQLAGGSLVFHVFDLGEL